MLRQDKNGIEMHGSALAETEIEQLMLSYFRLDDDFNLILNEICSDQRVSSMVTKYPGLRLLRQEPWECLIAFICSAVNNIPRIAQTMEHLAINYGIPITMGAHTRYGFPTPAELAKVSERELRALGLGFRAPYVAQAAALVAEGNLDLNELTKLPYAEVKVRLLECPGIGPKVADCISAFSLDKLEAFPIDIWVRRALREWYFSTQKPVSDVVLGKWANEHFGRYAAYAQQYLFHGRRMDGKKRSVSKSVLCDNN
jgi:N-glycosylase/DNA lyase